MEPVGNVMRPSSDIFIHALGYEKRSTAVLKSQVGGATRPISLTFPNEDRLSFRTNLEIARGRAAMLVDDYARFFRRDFEGVISKLNSELMRPARITIDVSSMNRTMIATVLLATLSRRNHVGAITMLYVPGEFREPKPEFPAIEQIGAVIPELSGFSANPELPIGIIVGLGYEYGLAVGLINRLEPRLTVCFRAVGHDTRYEDACRKANLDFDFGYNVTELGSYPLLDAVTAYNHLENVVFGMTKSFRVVIVPLGPKIFAALATLIAIKNLSKVATWRVAAKVDVSDVEPHKKFLKVELDMNAPLPIVELAQAAALSS